MQEYCTSAYLHARLLSMGLPVQRCGGTGLVATLRNGMGPVIAYRAEMDALPIREETGLAYASVASGMLDGTEVPVMHACGHDAHMAIALAVAEALSTQRETWRGTVVFIFQPGEETASGALAMVDDGLWEMAPVPEAIFAQHVLPSLAGTVQYTRGITMAVADSWRVVVTGRGSHGSQPQDSIDPIVMAASMVLRLQTIVSREIDPRDAAVVTVGTFRAGTKDNVIAGDAEFTVNVRALRESTRLRINASIARIIHAEAAASGAPPAQIELLSSFPTCYNDPDLTAASMSAIAGILGRESVVESPPLMASEDFGVLGRALDVPSVFWFFGGHSSERRSSVVPVNHSSKFAPVIEPSLTTGVTAALAVLLGNLRD